MHEAWTSGNWVVKEGMADEFIAAWQDLARWTADAYPGSRAWLLRDRERPNVFLSAGPWRDETVIPEWRTSAGFLERVGRIREMLETFEARTLDAVASSEPDVVG